MSSDYHLIKGSLDAQGKPNVIALLVASIVTPARAYSPVVQRVGGGHQAIFSTTCDGVVSYILQMVRFDFVSDRFNAENFNPC